MGFLFALGVVLTIAITFAIIKGGNDKKELAENEKKIRTFLSENDLRANHIIFTPHNNSNNSLSVNEKKKTISICHIKNDNVFVDNYSFDQVIGFDIDIDGESARKITVGGIIAGAALGGGLGALIGSQFGGKKSKVNLMHLVINVDDMSNPVIHFSILKPSFDGKPYNSDHFMVAEASKKAEKWSGIFKVILNRKVTE